MPTGSDFTPLMTCYLIDRAEPAELVRGFESGVVGGRQALSRPCHDQFGPWRHRHKDAPPGAGGDAADRHAAAGPWRGDRSGRRHFRPRGGVHRARAGGRGARLSGAEDRVRAYHHRRGGGVRRGCGAERRRDGDAAASAPEPQRDLRRAGSGRTLIACPWRSASGTGWRSGGRRCRARPNSSSARTARRTRWSGRKRRAAAPASSTRPSRWRPMPACSRRRGRWTGSRASPPSTGRASTVCR